MSGGGATVRGAGTAESRVTAFAGGFEEVSGSGRERGDRRSRAGDGDLAGGDDTSADERGGFAAAATVTPSGDAVRPKPSASASSAPTTAAQIPITATGRFRRRGGLRLTPGGVARTGTGGEITGVSIQSCRSVGCSDGNSSLDAGAASR
jgi:hypothetical protein